MAAHLRSLFPKALLGDLEPLAILGEGGMGTVFEARDRRLDRKVAVKIMRCEDLPPLRERFVREATTLASLKHPALVRVFAFGTLPEGPYLVMERIVGDPLDRAAARGGDALGWMMQVAEGLEEVHRHGLVHRDVKPSNVMVEPEGRAVLIDFGLVHDPRRTAMTRSGAVVGTFTFLAPELLRGAKASPASDFYAWGATLYAALEGRPPYEHGELVRAVAGEVLPPPRLVRVPMASPAAAVLLATLDPDPDARPATAADLVELLERSPERRARSGALFASLPAPRGPVPAPGRVGVLPLLAVLAAAALALVASGGRPGAQAPLPDGPGPKTLAPAPGPGPGPGPEPEPDPAGPARFRVRIEAGIPRPTHGIPGPAPFTGGDGLEPWVEAFELDRTEVTVGRFLEFVAATGRPPPPFSAAERAAPERAATGLTWMEAAAFASWAGGRLPTVGEWARAVESGRIERLEPLRQWNAGSAGSLPRGDPLLAALETPAPWEHPCPPLPNDLFARDPPDLRDPKVSFRTAVGDPAAPAPLGGRLRVRTRPRGAEIFLVDRGRLLGTSDGERSFELPPMQGLVLAAAPGHRPEARLFTTLPGTEALVELHLAPVVPDPPPAPPLLDRGAPGLSWRIVELPARPARITGLAVSGAGDRLAVATHGPTLLLEPLGGPGEAYVLPWEQGPIRALAFAEDGAFVAAGGWGGAAVWSVRDGQARRSWPGIEVEALAFRPDGRVVAGTPDGKLGVLSPEGVRLLQGGHTAGIRAVGCAGELVATGGDDGRVVLWDLETGSVLRTLVNGGPAIRSLAILPDGSALLAGDEAGHLIRIDPRGERSPQVLAVHRGRVTGVAGLGDSHALSLGEDRRLVATDLPRRRMIAELAVPPGLGALVAAPRAGSFVAAGGTALLRVAPAIPSPGER